MGEVSWLPVAMVKVGKKFLFVKFLGHKGIMTVTSNILFPPRATCFPIIFQGFRSNGHVDRIIFCCSDFVHPLGYRGSLASFSMQGPPGVSPSLYHSNK